MIYSTRDVNRFFVHNDAMKINPGTSSQHTESHHTDSQHTESQHTDSQYTYSQHTDSQHTDTHLSIRTFSTRTLSTDSPEPDSQHTDSQHPDSQQGLVFILRHARAFLYVGSMVARRAAQRGGDHCVIRKIGPVGPSKVFGTTRRQSFATRPNVCADEFWQHLPRFPCKLRRETTLREDFKKRRLSRLRPNLCADEFGWTNLFDTVRTHSCVWDQRPRDAARNVAMVVV